jgi:hypothetical protein
MDLVRANRRPIVSSNRVGRVAGFDKTNGPKERPGALAHRLIAADFAE